MTANPTPDQIAASIVAITYKLPAPDNCKLAVGPSHTMHGITGTETCRRFAIKPMQRLNTHSAHGSILVGGGHDGFSAKAARARLVMS